MTDSFGKRIETIRTELGLSQSAVAKTAGMSQPHLSKIEKGTRIAGPDTIDKIAASLHRDGLDLVRGTDREGGYTAARLTPEDRDAMRHTQTAAEGGVVYTLRLFYERVVGLFEAMYGTGVTPGVNDAEGLYIDLRRHCVSFAKIIDEFRPGTSDLLFFPDHIEPDSDFDDLLLAYDDYFRPELLKAKRALLLAEDEYHGFLSEEFRAFVGKTLPLEQIDESIRFTDNAAKLALKQFLGNADRGAKLSPQSS